MFNRYFFIVLKRFTCSFTLYPLTSRKTVIYNKKMLFKTLIGCILMNSVITWMILLEDTANSFQNRDQQKNTNKQPQKIQKYAEHWRYLPFAPVIVQPSLQLPSQVGFIDIQVVMLVSSKNICMIYKQNC